MKFKLEGVDKMKAALGRVQRKHEANVDKLLQGAALRTVAVAKSRLQPYGEDSREVAVEIAAVRQSINFSYDKQKKEVTVYAGNTGDDHTAAYLEFGTGKFAARYVPTLGSAYWTKLAMSFYKNGKGTLREHPYLIPAYKQEGQRLREKLKGLKIGW